MCIKMPLTKAKRSQNVPPCNNTDYDVRKIMQASFATTLYDIRQLWNKKHDAHPHASWYTTVKMPLKIMPNHHNVKYMFVPCYSVEVLCSRRITIVRKMSKNDERSKKMMLFGFKVYHDAMCCFFDNTGISRTLNNRGSVIF